MSGGFLEHMARASAARVAQARARVSDREMLARARVSAPPPRLALDPAGFDLIAEVKLRSPSAGVLSGMSLASAAAPAETAGSVVAEAPARELEARVRTYAGAGAAAVSVLTEPARFDGSLAHLEQAARALRASGVPAMRKDFLVDSYQVLEARVAGAGGVLVILRMLSERQVEALLDCARELELFVLLEAFDEADLERAHAIVEQYVRAAGSARTVGAAASVTKIAAVDVSTARTFAQVPAQARSAPSAAAPAPLLVGLNCRDLDTLQVVPGRLEALVGALPADAPRVAESGVLSPADAEAVAACGYDLALVGSALMRGGDPGRLAGDMLEAGRRAARGRPSRRQPVPLASIR